ncbi:hypothetical protein ACVWU4_001015 [Campylobacter coli]
MSNTNRQIPKVIKENPNISAILSKLNTTENKPVTKKNWDYELLNTNYLDISKYNKEKIKNIEEIISLFPDLEMPIDILITSIICPNDMLTTNLVYNIPNIEIPETLKQSILTQVKEYIDKNYGISKNLYYILRETLFTKGAYIEAIIPESSLDDLVNERLRLQTAVNTEEYVNTSKEENFFLGNPDSNKNITVSYNTEEYVNTYIKPEMKIKPNVEIKKIECNLEDLGISITEDLNNFNIKNKKLKELKKTVKNKLYKRYNANKEDNENQDLNETLDRFFKKKEFYSKDEILELNTVNDASRKTIGKPLVLKLPVEAVIPIFMKNEPETHLGYFVVVDENGLPVSGEDIDYENDRDMSINVGATSRTNINNDRKLGLITKARDALQGITDDEPMLNNISEIYNNLIEQQIIKRLNSGILKDVYELENNNDIYKLVFSRAIKNKETKLIFIPTEMVMYYAFEYRKNGTGKTILEKSALLLSIRGILFFARMMGTLKNSITNTVTTVTLDEDDPNPEQSSEKTKSEILKSREALLPIGLTSVKDMSSWVTMLGNKIKVIHPGLPNIDITTQDEATQKITPDEELDNKIMEAVIMSIGLNPEIVLAGYQTDYATTVNSRNLLMAKKTLRKQDILNPLINEHIIKYCQNDGNIPNMVKSIIKENITDIKKIKTDIKKKDKQDRTEEENDIANVKDNELIDYLTDACIEDITVNLPELEVTDADAMKLAFDNYVQSISTYIEEVFNSEAYSPDLIGEFGNKLNVFKSILKSECIVNWMAENKYLPELAEFLTYNKNGKTDFDAVNNFMDHVAQLADSVYGAANNIKKTRKASDKTNTKLGEIANPEEDENQEGGDKASDGETENTNEGDKANDSGDNSGTSDGSSGDSFSGDGDVDVGDESTDTGETGGGEDLGDTEDTDNTEEVNEGTDNNEPDEPANEPEDNEPRQTAAVGGGFGKGDNPKPTPGGNDPEKIDLGDEANLGEDEGEGPFGMPDDEEEKDSNKDKKEDDDKKSDNKNDKDKDKKDENKKDENKPNRL